MRRRSARAFDGRATGRSSGAQSCEATGARGEIQSRSVLSMGPSPLSVRRMAYWFGAMDLCSALDWLQRLVRCICRPDVSRAPRSWSARVKAPGLLAVSRRNGRCRLPRWLACAAGGGRIVSTEHAPIQSASVSEQQGAILAPPCRATAVGPLPYYVPSDAASPLRTRL